MHGLRTGQIAKQAGVHVETLRYYEREGLIDTPPRTASGYRQYPEETVARIRFIRRAQALGFSLQEIADLLGLRASPTANSAEMKARAQAKIADIEAKIRTLARIKETLTTITMACDGYAPLSACPILDALEAHEEGRDDSNNKGVMTMATRTVEIFSAGCAMCTETIEMVQRAACSSCDVTVLDMHDPVVAQRAKDVGIRSVPAVVIDGKLADCCAGRGPDAATLRRAGLGQPI